MFGSFANSGFLGIPAETEADKASKLFYTSPSLHRYGEHKAKTLREQEYLGILCTVLCKPLWWQKYNDPTIAAKWRKELDCTDVTKDFLFQELEYIATHRIIKREDGTPLFWPLTPVGAFISDNIIQKDLATKFAPLMASVEHQAFGLMRWHPNSENQVLDIIHPSNYCFVYGKTKFSMKPNVLFGDLMWHQPPKNVGYGDVSKKYQWLPSEFNVDDNGKVRIDSYINNLHPKKNVELYDCIAKIFEAFLPMFECAVGSFKKEPFHRINYDLSMTDSRSDWWKKKWDQYQENPEHWCDIFNEEYQNLYHSAPFLPDMEWDDFDDLMVYEDEGFSGSPKLDTSLRGKNLQVMVKVASIFLTPENLHTRGVAGIWRGRTMKPSWQREFITTRLRHEAVKGGFREIFNGEDLPYEQNEHRGIEIVYGLFNEESVNLQASGLAESQEGRCLVFPNSNQHRVPSFELEDKTKPGHRKMLVFFLVQPNRMIPSTRHVPPQQQDWAAESVNEILQEKLPMELVERIVKMSGCTWGEQEDKKLAKLVLQDRIPAETEADKASKLFYTSPSLYRYGEHKAKTLREQEYLGILCTVLCKPLWWQKYNDPTNRREMEERTRPV
ncbi:hypothetical protein BC829DRAFT_491421 [Chytridium lagenaria]|nr:hypothetical protein BC829DRAFT_491421 [Chytridium lagenaria]